VYSMSGILCPSIIAWNGGLRDKDVCCLSYIGGNAYVDDFIAAHLTTNHSFHHQGEWITFVGLVTAKVHNQPIAYSQHSRSDTCGYAPN